MLINPRPFTLVGVNGGQDQQVRLILDGESSKVCGCYIMSCES